MEFAMSAVTERREPIPAILSQYLPNRNTPWQISSSVFGRIQAATKNNCADKPYTAVDLTKDDPEYAFVLRYFVEYRPPGYHVKGIRCIYNPDQNMAFEGSLRGMEEDAKELSPSWHKEEPIDSRAKTIERWKSSVAPFSPFQISNEKGTSKFEKVKVVPLWHGTTRIDSICRRGFTYFGKHHEFDDLSKLGAKPGAQKSTDIGFFGSGIYLTNSAQYAALYSGNSNSLMLAWASMREPYPVVNDVIVPKQGKDMQMLEGRAAYQNYNAHFIPVVSTNPKNIKHKVYHACHASETPAWDEYVVFEKSQALPRFIVELGIDLPCTPSNRNAYIEIYKLLVCSSVYTTGSVLKVLLAVREYSRTQNTSYIDQLNKMIRDLSDTPDAPISFQLMSEYSRLAFSILYEDWTLLVDKKDLTGKPLVSSFFINSYGETDLHRAADTGDKNLCRKLLDLGYHPFFMSHSGSLPIHFAAMSGKTEVVEMFIETNKALLDWFNLRGETALMYAAGSGYLETCQFLLKRGANQFATTANNSSALHKAVTAMSYANDGKNYRGVVKLLVHDKLINARNLQGYTPLIDSAMIGDYEITQTLLLNRADPLLTDNDGWNVLHHFVHSRRHDYNKSNNLDTCRLLAGISQLLDMRNREGNTPLDLSRSPEITKILMDAKKSSIIVKPVSLPNGSKQISLPNVAKLNEKLVSLLEKVEIQTDSALHSLLFNKLTSFLEVNPEKLISNDDLVFYNNLLNLLENSGKIRKETRQLLLKPEANAKEKHEKEASPPPISSRQHTKQPPTAKIQNPVKQSNAIAKK